MPPVKAGHTFNGYTYTWKYGLAHQCHCIAHTYIVKLVGHCILLTYHYSQWKKWYWLLCQTIHYIPQCTQQNGMEWHGMVQNNNTMPLVSCTYHGMTSSLMPWSVAGTMTKMVAYYVVMCCVVLCYVCFCICFWLSDLAHANIHMTDVSSSFFNLNLLIINLLIGNYDFSSAAIL